METTTLPKMTLQNKIQMLKAKFDNYKRTPYFQVDARDVIIVILVTIIWIILIVGAKEDALKTKAKFKAAMELKKEYKEIKLPMNKKII